MTDGLTVPIDAHTAYEPDAMGRCGEPMAPDVMMVSDPVIVVEVISPSSAHTDTSAKLIGYFKLESVRHYLVIDPQMRTVTHHARGDDGTVSARTLTEGSLRLDPQGLTVEIADLMGRRPRTRPANPLTRHDVRSSSDRPDVDPFRWRRPCATLCPLFC